MKPKKIPPKEFKAIYSLVPRLCVEAVIQTKEGVLLTKRNIEPAKGKWHTPGGTVLKGETLKEAVIRVAKEETGLTVKPLRILDVLEFTSFPEYYGQPISLAFLAKKVSGTLKPDIQSTSARFFKTVPKNTIPEHIVLLTKRLKMQQNQS